MLSSQDLQQARDLATQRYLNVAAALKQEAGIKTHVIRKSLTGRAYVEDKYIIAPEGRTRKQLYILAHECGHVALGHKPGQLRYIKEYEAEQYAHKALRRHGIAVPRDMTKRAKGYVRRKLRQFTLRSSKAPRADIVAWVNG